MIILGIVILAIAGLALAGFAVVSFARYVWNGLPDAAAAAERKARQIEKALDDEAKK